MSDDDGTLIPFGRKDTNGNNGARPEGMDAKPVPFEEIEQPIDLVAVQADDELINALSAGMSVSSPGISGYDADDHVAAILAAWKAEVDADDIPELVDIETAVATIEAARRPSGRARHLAPLAAAAAFIVLAIGGLSVSSYNAEPGDALWGISKVLYSERAESVEAASRAETAIDNAKLALMHGQPVLAGEELKKAQAELGAIRPEEGAEQLAEVQDFLSAKAAETEPGESTDPGAPLKSDKTRQPPHGTAANEDPSTTDPTEDPSPSESPSKDPATSDPRSTRPESGSGGGPSHETTPSDPSTGKGDPRSLRNEQSGGPTSPAPTSAPGSGGIDEGSPSPTGGSNPSATSEGRPAQTSSPGSSTTTTTTPPPKPSANQTAPN